MNRPRLAGLLLLAALAVLSPGCASTPVADPAAVAAIRADPRILPIARTVAPHGYGSAILIDDGLWASCLHCVMPFRPTIELDGVERAFLPVMSGDPEFTTPRGIENPEDWIYFTLPHEDRFAPSPSLAIDFESPIPPGTDVLVIGYWAEGRDTIEADDFRNLTLAIIPARVERRSTPRLLHLRVPFNNYSGISGGAVIRWDAEADRPVLLALNQSGRGYMQLPSFRKHSVIYAVRPPRPPREARDHAARMDEFPPASRE